MSSSEDSTRPISVAELLARNGTIGAPPVGGHRRRRRRKSNSVSVAELTGEIPVVRDDEPPPAVEQTAAEETAADKAVAEESVAEETVAEEPVAEETVAEEPAAGEPVAEVSVVEEPVSEEAVTEEPVADEAVAEEPVAEEPVAEESAAEEAVAEEPVADEAVHEEAAAEEPADDEAVAGDEAVTGESVAEGAEAEEDTAAPEVAADEEVAAGEAVAEEEAAVEDVQPAELEEAARDGVTETAEAAIHEALTENVVTDAAMAETADIVQVDTVEAPPASRAVESPPLARDPLPSRRSGPERGYDPRPARKPASRAERASGAEQMAPDPVDQSVDLADLVDDQGADAEELRSYLRASGGTLFSGETVADERSRLGPVTDVIEPVAASAPVARRGAMSMIWHGVLAVLQSLLAVVFGAGLFIAFDQLWRWNNIVALVLSVLVILGLVVAVRLVRKTEDITSTLIAVAVGALVTLGPLALLQST